MDLNSHNFTQSLTSFPQDKDVPYTESLPLMHSFKTEDVHLTFLKHAGHTLVDKLSLEVIYDTILKLAAEVQQKNTQ